MTTTPGEPVSDMDIEETGILNEPADSTAGDGEGAPAGSGSDGGDVDDPGA